MAARAQTRLAVVGKKGKRNPTRVGGTGFLSHRLVMFPHTDPSTSALTGEAVTVTGGWPVTILRKGAGRGMKDRVLVTADWYGKRVYGWTDKQDVVDEDPYRGSNPSSRFVVVPRRGGFWGVRDNRTNQVVREESSKTGAEVEAGKLNRGEHDRSMLDWEVRRSRGMNPSGYGTGKRYPAGSHDRLRQLEYTVRWERSLTDAEKRELDRLYDKFQVSFLNRVSTGPASNPLGDPEHHKAEHYLGSILKSLDREGQFYDVMREHHGLSFTLRRHDDGDLTAAVRDTHQRMQGPEVVVPPDQIVDVYHYALHHGTLEGWEPGSEGLGGGDVEVDVENPYYSHMSDPVDWDPEQEAKRLLNIYEISGSHVALGPGNWQSGESAWDKSMGKVAGHGIDPRVPITREQMREAFVRGFNNARRGNPGSGYYVMTWGGGRYTSVAWYKTREEAERHVARLKAAGAWSGMPPKIEASNPAVSPEQYRLAQAVLSGTARESSMPAKVAREIVDRTPARLRSEYSRYAANPLPPGYEHIRSAQVRNEAIIAPYKGKLHVKEFEGDYVLTGVNDTGVLYWSRPGRKKEYVLGYRVEDLPALSSKSNPEESAAALYEKFHGIPSRRETVVTEEVHFHGHLTELGKLVELTVKTLSGYKAVLDFKDDPPSLCSSEDGRQLYIRGGNQEVPLTDLHMDAPEWVRDTMVLGEVLEIVYSTVKKFDGLKKIEYQHKFTDPEGTKGGERAYPVLIYDTLNSLLSFAGGTHSVEAAGIVG